MSLEARLGFLIRSISGLLHMPMRRVLPVLKGLEMSVASVLTQDSQNHRLKVTKVAHGKTTCLLRPLESGRRWCRRRERIGADYITSSKPRGRISKACAIESASGPI